MNRRKALKLRELIEIGAKTLNDDAALEGTELYPQYRIGVDYETGDRFRCENTLYKVLQPHTSAPEWPPYATPALYTVVVPAGTIPVWRQPTGAQDAYMTGDKVYYPDESGSIYESLIDYNTWSPDEYPAGWRMEEI